jgi:surface polysaccharide O-acyltransferase-like enzyme
MAKRLLILNGLAICGVVLNHASSWGFIAMFWWTDQYLPVTVPNFDQMGSFSYYFLRLIEQLVAFSVPSFLFVSGFFIAFVAGKSPIAERWKIARMRIITLLIPYLIWSFLIIASVLLLGEKLTPLDILKMLAFGKASEPYYFVPLLIQLYLLSPLILSLAKKHWKLLTVSALLIQLFVQSMRYLDFIGVDSPAIDLFIQLTPSWLFVTKMFWFIFGVVIYLHLQQFVSWLDRFKICLLGSWVVLLFLGMVEWEALLHLSGQDWIPYYDTGLDTLYACAFILCYLAYSKISIPFAKDLGKVGGKSYGIYLIHSIFIMYTARLIYHIAPGVLAYPLILFAILTVVGLGMPLVLMAITERTPARRWYSYLYG